MANLEPNVSLSKPEANLSSSTPESTQKEDGGDGGLFSTRNLILGGIFLGGLVAAIVSYSFKASRKPKSSKKSKSKKKKSSKAKTGTGKKTGTSVSKLAAPASKSTDTVASKSAISAPTNNDPPKKKDEDTAAVVEDIDEPGTANLQTEGPVSNEVFQSFLTESNKMLKESSMKDRCAAVYKSGGNVGKFLQTEQGKLWKKLGVDPEYGVKKLAESIQSGKILPHNNKVLRESLILEETLFSYAYHGSQEALDKEAARVSRLLARSQQELNETAQKYGTDRAKMQKYMSELMAEYKKINEELQTQNVQDPMVTTAIKAKMSDEKMLVLLKGQYVIMQSQQMMMMSNKATLA